MFTITPTGKRDAWSALDNELLAHRLRKREESKRNELRKVKAIAREIVQGLERGATLTTTRKRKG